MPDIVAEDFNGRHDFKFSLLAGFEIGLVKIQKSDLRFFHCTLLQTNIQMDVNTNDYGEEGIVFSGINGHIMKMVIIEYPVIYSFTGSIAVIDGLIFRWLPHFRQSL